MLKRLLLVLTMGLCGSYAALAQDPNATGVVINPNSLTVGQTSSVTVSFGNGSSSPILQASVASYSVIVPSALGVTASSVAVISPAGSTTTNLSLNVGAYNSTNGTLVVVQSNNGDVPGNAIYNLLLTVRAVKTAGAFPAVSVSAVSGPTSLSTNNNGNDNANAPFTVSQGSVQPVGLVDFTATAQANQTVNLAWTTSWEATNKGFLIERSLDLKAFQKVGEVTEIGATSQATKNYTLTDLTPYRGTSYYRLTQQDLDGKSTILKVTSVVLREMAYGVYPNPVARQQVFSLSLDEPETAKVGFYGVDGQPVSFQKAGVQAGTLVVKPSAQLGSGVYILTVEERGQSRQHRIVIE